MGITQECDYALRVVLFLSEMDSDDKTEAKVISEKLNIPLRFLLKLLRKLTVAGILNSYRGVGGGYSLARCPVDISLKDVIVAIDGPIYMNRCQYDSAYCSLNRCTTCKIHLALDTIQTQLDTQLQTVNFQEIRLSGNRIFPEHN
ncbi:RrF2 family transcriptional regulator [Anaeromicropila populeti]|uniref:Transcriptional regulator, BadM/Rrf2 family n=1 Tax=Anaeromicropila populeti TaxID=37658 RepID=A0A1I6KZT6_9FIRM|nr:Rrf2 family transcriptional regulator [Anaeromicropila populeti]SFR96732.1 transcriptional regulator, BadM/Rrf2 family [Anaeromicropila populeti]